MTTAYELGHALGIEKAALDPSTLQALIGGGAGAGLGGLGGYLLSDEDKLRNTLLAALAGGGAGAGLGYYRGRLGEEAAGGEALRGRLGKTVARGAASEKGLREYGDLVQQLLMETPGLTSEARHEMEQRIRAYRGRAPAIAERFSSKYSP